MPRLQFTYLLARGRLNCDISYVIKTSLHIIIVRAKMNTWYVKFRREKSFDKSVWDVKDYPPEDC